MASDAPSLPGAAVGAAAAPSLSEASSAPMASAGDEPQGAGSAPPGEGGGDGSKEQGEQEASKPFLPKQPIRDEMVRQAVSFLTHPKVKGSPIKFRRAFLEKKGLTNDEIDKAFQLVPDEATGDAGVDTSSAGTAYVTSQAAKNALQPAAVVPAQHSVPHQSQPASQILPPGAPGVAPGAPYAAQHGAVVPYGVQGPFMHPQAPPPPARKFTWVQVIGALAALGVAGAGTAVLAQRYAVPRLKAWLREQLKDEPEKDKKKGAEGSAAETGEEVPQDMGALMQEMKSMAAELKSTSKGGAPGQLSAADVRREIMSCLAIMNEFKQGASVEPEPSNAAPFERTQQLEREVADLKRALRAKAGYTVDAPHGLSKSAFLPGPSAGDQAGGSLSLSSSTSSLSGLPHQPRSRGGAAAGSYEAPSSKSYQEVLEMVQRGETPPGIRDINDKPPNPNQAPSQPQLAPRPKPWEQQAGLMASSASMQSASLPRAPQPNGTDPAAASIHATSSAPPPWLRQQGQTSQAYPQQYSQYQGSGSGVPGGYRASPPPAMSGNAPGVYHSAPGARWGTTEYGQPDYGQPHGSAGAQAGSSGAQGGLRVGGGGAWVGNVHPGWCFVIVRP